MLQYRTNLFLSHY